MIDLETIEREINELEARGDTTYSLCERLSWLYTVRDHIAPKLPVNTQPLNGSEFLELSSGVNYSDLMQILDEHMQAVRLVQSREYDAVINKIRALKK